MAIFLAGPLAGEIRGSIGGTTFTRKKIRHDAAPAGKTRATKLALASRESGWR